MKKEIFISETEVEKFLVEKNQNFIYNFLYLETGYTFLALDKILQADIPIVIVTENITLFEIKFLKECRKNVCVISINIAWKILLSNGIVPDFMMGNFFDKLDEQLNETPLIINVETDISFLEQHKGKKFFYWSENVLIEYLCKELKEKLGFQHGYPVIDSSHVQANVYATAIYIANYMNASKIILLGVDKDILCNINDDKLLIVQEDNLEQLDYLKGYCQIECHINETVDRLLPMLDLQGQKIFDSFISELENGILETLKFLEEIIKLYGELYEMAKAEIVMQSELQNVVARINICIEEIGKNKLDFYVMGLITMLDNIQPNGEELDCQNEVAQVAVEGKILTEKIRLIYLFLEKAFRGNIKHTYAYTKYTEKIVEKKRQSVLLVHGISQYNVLPNFVYGLKKGFQELGYDVYLWDLSNMRTYGYNLYQNMVGYDYIFMMNGVGIDVMHYDDVAQSHRYWYERENTETAVIFVDHPRWHMGRIEHIRPDVKMFLVDKYWCEYVNRYIPEVGKPYFIPLGGMIQEGMIKFEDKEDKIVFFGSGQGSLVMAQEINNSPHKNLAWNVIEYLISYPQYTVEAAMREVARKYKCLYSVENIMRHSNILLLIDHYIRAYFREEVIMSIAKSGISFDIYGWRNEEITQYTNVTLKEKVSFEEMLNICQKTKFVLNTQPWAKGGTQERVFNTMLGGSICVTDTSEYLLEELQDNENIIFYDLKEIDVLPGKLKYYMEHTNKAKRIAQRGYEIASEKHTLEKRAKEMMELLKNTRD